MSYLALELDALNKAPSAARAARVSEDVIIGGLTRMWAHCFREKTASLSSIQVAGFFSTDLDTVPALVAFGFLAHEADAYRVKGADRYLRVAEGRSKGGKTSSRNLIPGGQKTIKKAPKAPNIELALSSASAETQPSPSRDPSRDQADASSRLTLGLSPSTEHLILKDIAPNKPAPIAESPKPIRHSDLLCADFTHIIGEPYAWQGARDGVALAALLEEFHIDKIRERWRIGLKAPVGDWASCRTIGTLKFKWNDLAQLKPSKASVEHQPSRLL